MQNDLNIFFSAGEKICLRSNFPVKATEFSGFSAVESGEINIFLSSEQGGKSGPRQYITTLTSGALLPPGNEIISNDGVKRYFLLVPVMNSVIRMRSVTDFAAETQIHTDECCKCIDAWLQGLFGGLERYVNIDTLPLGDTCPENKQTLAAGENFSPEKGLWWLEINDGSVLFCGDEEFPLFQAPATLILTPRYSVKALEECQIQCRPTSEMVLNGSFVGLLDKINENVINCLLITAFYDSQRNLVDEEYDRKSNDLIMQARIGELEMLVSPSSKKRTPPASNPLALALNVVANDYKLDIKFPLNETLKADYESELIHFSEANQWRTRRVALPAGFEHYNSGIIVGFYGEKLIPVAMNLCGKSSSWTDPENGISKPLDHQTAMQMTPFGYCFYENLPNRQLTWKDTAIFLFRDAKISLYWLLVIGIISGLLGLVQPMATSYVTGKIIPTSNIPELWQLLILLLALTLSQTIMSLVQQLNVLIFGTKQLIRLQTAIFDRLFRLPIDFFRKFNSGDLCMRVLSVISFQETIFKVLSKQFVSSIFSLCSLIMLFYYSWKLTLWAIPLSLAYVAIMYVFFIRTQKTLKLMTEAKGREAGFLKQMFDGVSKIRGAGAERRILNRFLQDFIADRKAGYEYGVYSGRIATFALIFPGIVYIIFFYLIGEKWRGSMEISGFLAFLTAYGTFQAGVIGLVNGIWELGSMLPELKRLEPILFSNVELQAGQLPPGKLDGRVELSHIDFRYSADKPLVIKDVSFYADPGEFIAIVGPSGAGKSSLVRLLLGFEKPESGSIFYSGSDLSELDVTAVRRQLGVILQNSRVMPGSILANITTGTNYTLEDAKEAVRMAALDKDIENMPMGMFTMVADGLISGGQQQRILIARAIIGKPAVIIMDESTSALDNETQEIVRKNVEKLRATRVVIAHRLSTIINADRIYVMDNGEVKQSGTYEELMAVDGIFKQLAQRQIL